MEIHRPLAPVERNLLSGLVEDTILLAGLTQAMGVSSDWLTGGSTSSVDIVEILHTPQVHFW